MAPLRPLPRKDPSILLWGGLIALALLVMVGLMWRGSKAPAPSTPSDESTRVAPSPAAEPAATATGGTGSLIVDATPWGQVTRIVDADGREVELPPQRATPLVLRLAPGRVPGGP